MSKFNQKQTAEQIYMQKQSEMDEIAQGHKDVTTNLAGGTAYIIPNAEEELYVAIANSLMGEDKYYQTGKESDLRILQLIQSVSKTNPKFILQLARYAREELHLRSAPIFLLANASRIPETKPFVKAYTPLIVKRADEIAEVLQLHKTMFLPGKNIKHTYPASLKKGLAVTFKNFDEYQFSKYNREGEMKLKDALRIVIGQIKEKDETRRALYTKILTDTLQTADTWETKMSTQGSTKENWQQMLDSGNMGIFAIVRNLRNMLEKEVDITKALEQLKNPEVIYKSQMLPFRFYSAYKEIDNVRCGNVIDITLVKDALIVATKLSIRNVPKMNGTTFVTCDTSGSMDQAISDKTKVKRVEIGALLGAMANSISDRGIVSVFGDGHQVVNITKEDSILTNMRRVLDTNVGWSTNGYLAIKYLNQTKIPVDRIMIFTDEEMYGGSLYKELLTYKHSINKDVKLYIFNLSGDGTTVVPRDEPNVCLIGGWSEKIFDFIQFFENEKGSVLDKIKNEY